jgi:hypothetical protein
MRLFLLTLIFITAPGNLQAAESEPITDPKKTPTAAEKETLALKEDSRILLIALRQEMEDEKNGKTPHSDDGVRQVFERVLGTLQKQIEKEIDSEAADLNLDKKAYLEDGRSYDRFVSSLESAAPREKSDEKLLLDLIKIAIRLNFQKNVRFITRNHFTNEDKVIRSSRAIAEQLKIASLL